MKIEVDFSLKNLAVVLLGAVLLYVSGHGLVYTFQGMGKRKRPTVRRGTVYATEKLERNEAISIAATQPDAQNIGKFESARVSLEAITRKSPDDYEAQAALGEVRFSLRDFQGAVDAFRTIPETHPQHTDITAKIGSALTLLGKQDQAVLLLASVVEKRPGNFKAQAYYALALSAAGRVEEAATHLEEAIRLAPSEEARQRLQAFKANMKAKSTEQKDSDSAGSFEDWIRSHPVVGPKVVSVELVDSEGKITVQKFPMDKMPAGMRDQFLAKVWKNLPENIGKVLFKDGDSGRELYQASRP